MDEEELTSDSTLLFPTSAAAGSEDQEEGELDSETPRYLFPSSEFEPDRSNAGSTTGNLIRDTIVRDMITLILNRVVPTPPGAPQPLVRNGYTNVLSRDEIIHRAMQQAYVSWHPAYSKRVVHHESTKPDPLDSLRLSNLNRNRKMPPIQDPDIRDLVVRGRLQGYSEAAFQRTRRDNSFKRLLVPDRDEAQTVALWKQEEKYRQSISKLKGYTA